MTAQDIKEFGYRLGYSKVGITSADGFPEDLIALAAGIFQSPVLPV